MRVMVLFDLPVETVAEQRAYRQFRKRLIGKGFLMMQESVYTKIVQNPAMVKAVTGYIKRISPTDGLIQVLTVTEKQFAGIELIIGKNQTEVVDSTERLVVL